MKLEGIVSDHLPPKATTKSCRGTLECGADARKVGTKADSSVSGAMAIGVARARPAPLSAAGPAELA